jgi:diguanylate cyclase (GGDEF)-like protein
MNSTFKAASDTTILIVDDTPENLRLMAKILEPEGYIVRKALNGRMALQSAFRTPPDIILLDINMPQMSGYEVCQELKAVPATAQVPIIFISALDHIQDKVQAFETGGSDYITKPFQHQEVIMRVKNQLLIRQQYHELERQKQQLLEKTLQLEYEIQERQKAESAVRQLSITDDLTNLLNRRGFFLMATQQLKLAHRSQTPCCLLFADLDNLKTINDTLGHSTGDQTIIDAAEVLRACFRDDDIVARIGGDEFVALLLIDELNYGSIKTRLEEKIKHFNSAHDQPYSLSISFGIIHCSLEQDPDLAEILRQADALMYEHKISKKLADQESPSIP